MNCAEGKVTSNGAELSHVDINNGWRGGPAICPKPAIGTATFLCNNGTTELEEVTEALPVSPEDHQAIKLGNESSSDARFILCGCCFPAGPMPPVPPVEGTDTGIYIWVAAVGGSLVLVVVTVAGWYFLPRQKKLSRVVPEVNNIKEAPDDPRPIADKSYEALLDAFCQELEANPKVAKTSIALMQLPDKERRMAIEDMLQDPKLAKNFFTQRDMQYCLAIEDVPSFDLISQAPAEQSDTNMKPPQRLQSSTDLVVLAPKAQPNGKQSEGPPSNRMFRSQPNTARSRSAPNSARGGNGSQSGRSAPNSGRSGSQPLRQLGNVSGGSPSAPQGI
jgi:hypothetical protein